MNLLELARLRMDQLITEDIAKRKTLSVADVDERNIKLPNGYVQRGRQYVYQPELVRIPIQIQSADGTVKEGEFTGYYDLTQLGKGVVPSVGFRLPDGNMTHTLLAPDQKIIGNVPTYEEWNKRSTENQLRSETVPTPSATLPAEAITARLTELGARPDSQITLVNDPSAPWDARSVFDNGQLQRIELNAAKIGSVEQIDSAIEHEAAHVVEQAGAATEALSALSDQEKISIFGDMLRLGYTETTRQEFDARGVDTLAQAWKGRNWFERVVGYVAEFASRLKLPMTRLGAERAAARAVAKAIKSAYTTPGGEILLQNQTGTTFESKTPQTFTTRKQVEAAVSDPLLTPVQIQINRDLAAVGSSMVSDKIMGVLMATPKDRVEKLVQEILDYLGDRRFTSDTQKWLASLPETTDEEKQAKEVAGAIILNHYGVDRNVERKINSELTVQQGDMANAFHSIFKLNASQMKAYFNEQMVKHLPEDFRKYISNLRKTGPAGENLKAEFRQRLVDAERRLNDQEQSPGALQKALQTIAKNIPDNLLVPAATVEETNTGIINWVNEKGTLNGVVGDSVKDWLLTDVNGPALLGYTRLATDLKTLKEVLSNQQAVLSDIKAFQEWFSPTGKNRAVSPKAFAQAYFKFRTGRDRAMNVVSTIEKHIGDLDADISANIIAREHLQELMGSPEYVATVREAAKQADVVVRAIQETRGVRGLMERGGEGSTGEGFLKIQVIDSENEYIVDLNPNSSQEQENRANLSAAVLEMTEWADKNDTASPVLADEYRKMADYIQKHLLHPSLDPKQGFMQLPWFKIPGFSRLRVPLDPWDALQTIVNPWAGNRNIQTIKDVLQRIGGRPALQAMKDAFVLDTVMKKVEGINQNKDYGSAAQNASILKALESHGWSDEQAAKWIDDVSERIIASGQNSLSPAYEAGDVIVGTGVKITPEDMAAVRLMKRWEDAVKNAAPPHIREMIGDLSVLRKAIGSGRLTMTRIPATWTTTFQKEWQQAKTDAAKWKLFSEKVYFKNIIMGLVGETNPEYSVMNPASSEKSPLFDIYRSIAKKERGGSLSIADSEQLLDVIAKEMVDRGMSPTFAEARDTAQKRMLSELSRSIDSYITNVLGHEEEEIWGGVPPATVRAVTANNSFTRPRGELVAPSTFYSYSTALDGRRAMHTGHLRSLLSLKVIQSLHETKAALDGKKKAMDQQVKTLTEGGMSKNKAFKTVYQQSVKDRENSDIRYDYLEILQAIKALDQALTAMENLELSTSETYQHAGASMLMSLNGVLKSQLLASILSATTNLFSATYLGPAMVHAQTGRGLNAIKDVIIGPHMWKAIVSKAADVVAGDPYMSKILKKHGKFWEALAERVIKSSHDWKRLTDMAHTSGMVSPFNWKDIVANKKAMPATAGRFEAEDDLSGGVEFVNRIMSLWGVRHYTEGVRAVAPRATDIMANYTLVASFQREMDWLKTMGRRALMAREEAAKQSGADWRDMTNPANILTPGDFGLKSHKGLHIYRDLFIPLGSLDSVILDYYDRTKGMSPEAAAKEPLIQNGSDEAGLALSLASKSNVATETNRPKGFQGKGSEGVFNNMIGTFMGWAVNNSKEMSRLLQRHSKDPGFDAYRYMSVATIIMLLALVGAWNYQLGDWMAKLLTNQSAARIKPGNIKDWQTALMYFNQSVVNVVPLIGSTYGNLWGVAFTGRGNPFDMSSQIPALGIVKGTYDTIKRIVQTGDFVLPMADFVRQWGGSIPRSVINRIPPFRGLVDQQNAVRALYGSAPPGTEIQWGQGGSGNVKYGPAHDEIGKLIASAYDAIAHGGSLEAVYQRRQDAINAYIKAGRSPEDAAKAVDTALAAKEPIRILTGREFTADEEQRWVKRMTPSQKKDYDLATKAWALLGTVTGKDLNMVSTQGGGGSVTIPGITTPRTARATLLAAPAAFVSVGVGYTRPTGVRTGSLIRRTGARAGLRRKRFMRGPRAARIRQPRIGRSRIRRRAGLAMRRPGRLRVA